MSGSTAIYLVSSFSLTQAILVLVSLCAGAIAIGADRAVVLEGSPVLAAVVRGWNLLRGRFSSYIKIGLVAALVTLALGLLMALAQSLMVGPAAAFGVPATEVELARLNANPFMPAAMALNVAFNTLALILLTGVWTLAFRHWQGKN